MTKAIRIHAPGGPEAMIWEDVTVGDPGPGQVRLRHTMVGVNYIDVYHRMGLYPMPLPAVIGMEAAGVVEAVGDGVSSLALGDRVAYASVPPGAYSEARLIAANRVVAVPDSIDDRTAASMMLQGITAHYLLHRTYPVKKGDTILLHAAAGGVGMIVCQWARKLGVTVIGTVGTDEKADLAKANGCTHTINYSRENFTERVKELTGGAGVPVVYDSVGKTTFEGSLDCLQPMGMMVSFGNASGPVEAFNLGLLTTKGSLFVTRPSLVHYTATPEGLAASAGPVVDMVASGKIKISVNQEYPLSDAAQAHRDLEARKTTGSTVLIP